MLHWDHATQVHKQRQGGLTPLIRKRVGNPRQKPDNRRCVFRCNIAQALTMKRLDVRSLPQQDKERPPEAAQRITIMAKTVPLKRFQPADLVQQPKVGHEFTKILSGLWKDNEVTFESVLD